MSEYFCFLITVLMGDELIRCALKFKLDDIDSSLLSEPLEPDSVVSYPMEDESRKVLHSMLPLHVRNMGPIVEVQEIFEIHIL